MLFFILDELVKPENCRETILILDTMYLQNALKTRTYDK